MSRDVSVHLDARNFDDDNHGTAPYKIEKQYHRKLPYITT